MADDGSTYICGVFETRVVVGRVSQINLGRAVEAMKHRRRRDRERLEKYQTGTRAELLRTFPDLLGDWSFDEADQVYELNPIEQVEFERADL